MIQIKITEIGKDIISIDENNNENLINIQKVHIIKLNFLAPTHDKVEKVLRLYPKTNRYLIDNNIKFYNYILKNTNKKYYIEFNGKIGLISFFRKNNKILLNFMMLSPAELDFALDDRTFEDILYNTEVILINQQIFDSKKDTLNNWNGNVIISEDGII